MMKITAYGNYIFTFSDRFLMRNFSSIGILFPQKIVIYLNEIRHEGGGGHLRGIGDDYDDDDDNDDD